MAKDGKIHLVGLLCSLIFGLGFGVIPYLLTKMFNLDGWFWFIPFAFLPPVIGAIIYALSNGK